MSSEILVGKRIRPEEGDECVAKQEWVLSAVEPELELIDWVTPTLTT